jgi:hypothetical protein
MISRNCMRTDLPRFHPAVTAMAALVRRPRDSSLIVWAHQRGLDVKPERLRHVGDGAHDPAKPGDWAIASSTPAISSSVVRPGLKPGGRWGCERPGSVRPAEASGSR